MKLIRLAILFCVLAPLTTWAEAPIREIKIATLAPKGSTWMKYLVQVSNELERLSKERGKPLKIKYYWGGVQGDEEVVVDKMKSGQLDGGILTAVGLSKILPDVLVYQLPFLFNSNQELDNTRAELHDWFQKKFNQEGYHLTGWGDVGYTYFFSNHEIHTPQDLAKGKMWVWSDPMVEAIAEFAGASPIHLGVPDVLPSMSTGMIDIVYSSPLAALSLQWATNSKYIESVPWQIGIGAAVVRKSLFDELLPDERELFETVNQRWMPKLLKRTRNDNRKSVDMLKKLGIKITKVSAEEKKEWLKMAEFVEKKVTGSFLSTEVVDKVKASLKAQRAK